MGLRGPRPELPAVAKLKGNPGKRKPKAAGVVAGGEPFVADHLNDDAKACVELIRASMPPRTYATVDGFLLAAFAQAWALHKEAAQALKGGEPTVEVNASGSRGPGAWVKVLNAQAQLMASLGDRLGLDPKARAALKVVGDDKPKSKFEGLTGGASKAH